MYSLIFACFLQFISVLADKKGYESLVVQAYNKSKLQDVYGGNLHYAIYDITKGYPSNKLTIVCDVSTESPFITHLVDFLIRNEIVVTLFNITTPDQQDEYFAYLTSTVNRFADLYTIHFCTPKMSEHVLLEIYDRKLIRRNVVFMFYWGNRKMYRYFLRNMHETMKVVVITNPRPNAYRLYYNQATSYKQHNLQMYNWWIAGKGLFHHPTLPNPFKIFNDFKGRLIYVPVIHKPPWHFVYRTNDSIQVTGGRDDKLLRVIADKLKFRYEYFDPPERIQGTSFNVNGTFEGVLGLLWEKEAEFFIGDVALTQERLKAVEFSFLTLADSGAFVTHAPSKLNEALALIRPFNWQVWPAIILTVLLSGPVLYMIIAVPNAWQPRFIVKDHTRLFMDCAWYTTGVFFKQTCKAPSESHKSRFFVILLAVSATYVIGDMYAANLTSLLARPGREKPINNLAQLEEAMIFRGYKLMVERHSSSYSLLENGTGVYERLWKLMNAYNRNPSQYLVDSVEQGVEMVRDATNIAVMAGRETLYFDKQRFGSNHFHLSEKLNTAYSAIALQLGCPYKENFNWILMGIFEAGILTKMTLDEYENLGKQQTTEKEEPEEVLLSGSANEGRKSSKANLEDNEKSQPISIKMLQGAFYLLSIGHVLSGLVLGIEIVYHRNEKSYRRKKQHHRFLIVGKVKKRLHFWSTRAVNYVRRKFREAMNDAVIATLEYTD